MHYFTRCICSGIFYAIAKPSVGHDSPDRVEAVVEDERERDRERESRAKLMRTPRPFIYSVQLFLACQQINRPPGPVELNSKAAAAAATKVFFFTLALSAC